MKAKPTKDRAKPKTGAPKINNSTSAAQRIRLGSHEYSQARAAIPKAGRKAQKI